MDYKTLEKFHDHEVGLRLSCGSSLVGKIYTPANSALHSSSESFTVKGMMTGHDLEKAIEEYSSLKRDKSLKYVYVVDSSHVTAFRII
ncbi:hypothetical protein COU57_03420 [Candidatus Pacearchaeota archaeon CG10_big_fil_rev_8_21_14_0_10_32_14]|nr:MAG: hypothetical protein COU57_03420 [Candidatus Pacearchaeota archaeon CG10_big_fil_rev_8_21_14_0_10_32_14]